ncbi:MAG: hypothetical protein NT039_04710 [Candidatus Berkelbacteria bacterium]|nr:hypothetical protein [Candidatus Berkelbacteria bacterium]
MRKIEKKRIFIIVKAYPNPSKKYGETVCCAGVDLNNYKLVRLYPIPFRDLNSDQKFKKYSIIEVNCFPPSDDKRPESLRVDPDSINVIATFDTDKGTWKRRKDIVLRVPIKSMCQVYIEAETDDVSLGLIRPENVTLEWAKQSLADQGARAACYAQLSLFNKQKTPIEEIPLDFYYKFKCAGLTECPGHKLSIIDWELRQSYRKWKTQYPTESILLEKIEQRWLAISDTTKNDVYFYVGNLKRFRNIFMVLGIFYPPKSN